MAIVTISRDFSSGGGGRARMLANELGYHFVDKNVIGKVLDSYGLIDFKKNYDTNLGFWGGFHEGINQTFSMLNRVTRSVARHGNAVILGRGSFAVLEGLADVINVRVKAPFAFRVARLMAEKGVADLAKAEAIVRDGDRVRSSFLHSAYSLHWDQTEAFDLVVDVAKIAPEDVVAFLVDCVRRLEKNPPSGALASEIEADSILDKDVIEKLGW